MSERFEKLFSLESDLYLTSSPVLIAAGALLKDTVSGKVLAQLKLRSLSDKPIRAVTVALLCKDTAGRVLGEEITRRYLDLSVRRGEDFGQQTALFLEDATTRSFAVRVTEVIFAENDVWTAPDGVWTPLPAAELLFPGEPEMTQQFQLHCGCADATYKPQRQMDLWYCTCGNINRQEEKTCHVCGAAWDTISTVDAAELRKERDARLEAARLEAEHRAEEERIAAEERRIAEKKAAKKRKKIIAITALIVCACIAFVIVLNTVIIPTAKYNKAVETFGQEWVDTVKNVSVGDTITFGAYEQDNNTSNGKEAIEWTVLDKNGMSLLLISDKALDCQQYNASDTDVTWETCSLRAWMNGTFLNNAFSTDERSIIQSTTVSADKKPEYSTTPGNATTDKVFLLSHAEAEQYFPFYKSRRKCEPTEYAIAQGAETYNYDDTDSIATCWWWLRSPGYSQDRAATVISDGSVCYSGDYVDLDIGCVRPALWINLE